MLEQMVEAIRPLRRDLPASIHVWNSQQFAIALEPYTRRSDCTWGSFYGVEIREDRALQFGWVEFRNQFGDVVKRINFLGDA